MEQEQTPILETLDRWEAFTKDFRLPDFDALPRIGLYMDQVVALVTDYLSCLVGEGEEERLITPAMVNNYVKMKLLPPPVKKKYGRAQLACLIMICILKQTLRMDQIKTLLPTGGEDAIRSFYDAFARAHRKLSRYVCEQVRAVSAPLINGSDAPGAQANSLVLYAAVAAEQLKLLSARLIALAPADGEAQR